MQWEIKKGVVTDEQGEIVCLLADTASEYHLFFRCSRSQLSYTGDRCMSVEHYWLKQKLKPWQSK